MSDRLLPATRDLSWISPRPPKKTLLQVLEDAIADPDPMASAEQLTRFIGDDITSLTIEALDDERLRLRFARAFGLITNWGRVRLSRLDAESERRRRVRP